MIDHSLKSLNFVTPLDSVGSSSTETGPSGKPIVRTEEGIITEAVSYTHLTLPTNREV